MFASLSVYMAQAKSEREVRQVAVRAIDADEARELLRTASGEEPTDDAVTALQETLADEAVELTRSAGRRSRRRGRGPVGEDVGRAADDRYGPMRSFYYRD